MPAPKIPVTIAGVVYPSKKDACEAFGVKEATVYARQRQGEDLETALAGVVDRKGRAGRPGTPITVYGVTYSSIAKAAKAVGLPILTVRKRLARGLGPDDAFAPGSKPIPCEGYKDLESACWEHGLNYIQTYRKVKGGSTFEEVVQESKGGAQ